jgi:hypothetical protein
MSRIFMIAASAALFLGAGTLQAQERPEVPEEYRVKKLPSQSLSGPRFGFTAFTGQTADNRDAIGLEPIMSQFGWQFERQLVSTSNGAQALLEWVLLVGGVEQGEFNGSMSFLAGLRTRDGFEFGAGPNFNYNPDNPDQLTQSMIVAVGATVPMGDFYVPVNVAMGLAEGGPRINVLLGWIVG